MTGEILIDRRTASPSYRSLRPGKTRWELASLMSISKSKHGLLSENSSQLPNKSSIDHKLCQQSPTR